MICATGFAASPVAVTPLPPHADRRSNATITTRAVERIGGSIVSHTIDAMVAARSIHHVGVAVDDLDGAIDTYARLFGATLEHRERVEEQGVEAASIRVGESRVELLGALGRGHAGRSLPRQARSRHAPRRVRGRRHSRRARRSCGRRRRADRRDAAPRDVRSRGRVRPPGLRPRRSLGGGVRG